MNMMSVFLHVQIILLLVINIRTFFQINRNKFFVECHENLSPKLHHHFPL